VFIVKNTQNLTTQPTYGFKSDDAVMYN